MIFRSAFNFESQNILLKLFLVAINVIMIAFLNLSQIFILFLILLFYCLFHPSLILNWLRLNIKFTFLYISIFLLGIFLEIPFPYSLLICFKISYLLLCSVYLSRTTPPQKLLNGTSRITNKFWQDISYYLAATMSFIPVFIENYRILKKTGKTNMINIISESFSLSYKSMHEIKIDFDNKEETKEFWTLKVSDIPLGLVICSEVLLVIYYGKILP